MVTNHLSWQIGDGCSALFWNDSWNGMPALTGNGQFQDLKNLFVILWG